MYDDKKYDATIQRILAPLIVESTPKKSDDDYLYATDYWVHHEKPLRMAARVWSYQEMRVRHPWSLFLRVTDVPGVINELDKIFSTTIHVDWYFVGFTQEAHSVEIDRWFVVDLNVLRAAYLNVVYGRSEFIKADEFCVIDLTNIGSHDVIVASSHLEEFRRIALPF